jgi:hypothetical protein
MEDTFLQYILYLINLEGNAEPWNYFRLPITSDELFFLHHCSGYGKVRQPSKHNSKEKVKCSQIRRE